MNVNTGLMKVAQMTDYITLSEKTIRRLIKHDQLPNSHVGDRHLQIRPNNMKRYINDTSNAHIAQIDHIHKNDAHLDATTATLAAPLANLVFADVIAASVNGPRMVTMFTGAGGLDLGFSEAGFHIIWGNDFDNDAQAVHALNLGFVDGRNIMDIDENEIPDCDILTAGFPCQPFSNAGNRRGVHDSRGMLYKECLRIIAHKMPKVIVFENVKGLLSTKYIDGRNLIE